MPKPKQLLILIFTTTILISCLIGSNAAAEPLSRIEIGAPRTKVLEKLSDAWHHDECSYELIGGTPSEFRDLFWYGPEDVTKANVIIVVYKRSPDSQQWIVSNKDYVEREAFSPLFYGDCISLDLSPLEFSTPLGPMQ